MYQQLRKCGHFFDKMFHTASKNEDKYFQTRKEVRIPDNK